MLSLFSKDEDIEASPSIIGYEILRLMDEKKLVKISLFDLADYYKNKKWFSPKSLYFGMFFLYSTGLIEFKQPYILKNV